MGMTRDQAIAILAKDQKYTRQWKLGEGYLDGKDVNGNYYDVSKQPQSGSSAKNGEAQKENTASNTQQQTEQKVAPGTRKYGNVRLHLQHLPSRDYQKRSYASTNR